MLVHNWMEQGFVVVNGENSMLDAIELMKENNLRMLPVMEKAK